MFGKGRVIVVWLSLAALVLFSLVFLFALCRVRVVSMTRRVRDELAVHVVGFA